MSEPRKNHLSIDGGQVKEDDHVATYKPIPETDTGFRTSKSSLSKSKEKVADGAEEKLLQKEDEAKIVRVDMADAKYVVGDHRNGDAKIELDANKRQFSGLTKEELMKYADDPFWVNLRWCMFVLFWAMWLAMLAGAIAIIVRAPKCAPPTPREWFEKWPLAECDAADYAELEAELPHLKAAKAAVFVEVPTYDVDKPDVIDKFKAFVIKAKEASVKVIVDLTANFVSTEHPWFNSSVYRVEPYTDYFVWLKGTEFDSKDSAKPTLKEPRNWVSTLNEPAWKLNDIRNEFYLHQYRVDQADLNFRNEKVVAEFKSVLAKWMKAGAEGVRLNKARQLVVDPSQDEQIELAAGKGTHIGADHTQYTFFQHKQTSDLPDLDHLLTSFSAVVDENAPEPGQGHSVFTLKEDGGRMELYLKRAVPLRPPSAAAVTVTAGQDAVKDIDAKTAKHWPALQLKSPGEAEAEKELALFSLLLPAAPVLDITQLKWAQNDTTFSGLVSLRADASVEHGRHAVLAVPTANTTDPQIIACARWKPGHTGYLALYNPTEEQLTANLTSVPAVSPTLTVHHMSERVKELTGYKKSHQEKSDNIVVPGKSALILSYVPQTTAES